jgi:hypothetical protein
MQEPGDLEWQAVFAREVHGNDSGARFCARAAPRPGSRRIGDAACAHVEVRDRAGREDHQRSLTFEPTQCMAHGARIAARTLLAEYFDRQEHGTELVQRAEVLIGEDLEIRAKRA